MSEWISVKDRLPKSGDGILIARDLGDRTTISIEVFKTLKYWGKTFNNVTHWMPLPQPPEETDQ